MKRLTLFIASLLLAFSASADYVVYKVQQPTYSLTNQSDLNTALVLNCPEGYKEGWGCLPPGCYNGPDDGIICPSKLGNIKLENLTVGSLNSGTNIGGMVVTGQAMPAMQVPYDVYKSGSGDIVGNGLHLSLQVRYDMHVDFKPLLGTSFCDLQEFESFCFTVEECVAGTDIGPCKGPIRDFPPQLEYCPQCIVNAAVAETQAKKEEEAKANLVLEKSNTHPCDVSGSSEAVRKCKANFERFAKCYGSSSSGFCKELNQLLESAPLR